MYGEFNLHFKFVWVLITNLAIFTDPSLVNNMNRTFLLKYDFETRKTLD